MPSSKFSLRPERMRIVDIDVDLLVVADLESLIDRQQLLRDSDAPEPPYWAHLWAGGRVLAEAVAAEPAIEGRRVLEVGCGLGLPGIVAALRGAATLLCDNDRDAVVTAAANAQRNAATNAYPACVDVLHPGLRGTFDFIIGADVTYDPKLQVGLSDLIQSHLSPSGQILFAESVRETDGGFIQACEQRNITIDTAWIPWVDEGHATQVRMLRGHRRD